MKTEIRVWDLPSEKIYIQLKKGFREDFFTKAYKKFNNWRLLGEHLDVKRGDTTLARNWKRGMNCYPLNIIFKIGKLINISKQEIEENVIQIKAKTQLNKRGGSSGKPIFNPKFPIKINEDFAEILGHICGDGTIVRKNPKKGIRTAFVNSEPILIKSFSELMKKVFGNINPYIDIRDNRTNRGSFRYTKPNYQISYPTIISYIILSIFNYKSREEMRLPSIIFDLDEKSKCRFLRALFDDEGYITERNKSIRIGMKPLKVIEDIYKLLKELKMKTTGIKKEGNMFYLKLYSGSDVTLFYEKINFKHPMKKERLSNIIKKGWRFRRLNNGEAKVKILDILKNNKHITIIEIASLLKKHPSTIREHFRRSNLCQNVKGVAQKGNL